MLFAKDDGYRDVYAPLHEIMSQSLWLSDAAFTETRKLNLLLINNAPSTSGIGLIVFGKAHYKQIAELRVRLEEIFAADMLSLYKVRSFLKAKRPARHFEDLSSQP
jgi:hypothetical protein